MKLILDGYSGNGLTNISTEHKGQSIPWCATAYNRSTLQQPEKLFDNINGFLESLPMKTQDSIWAHYKFIKETINEVSDSNRVHKLVRNEVKRLYDIIDFEDIRKYLRLKGNIQIPIELKVDLDSDGNDLTEKLTYLRDDYYDLTVYSVLLKPMLPIFGEYINYSAKEIGTKFRDHYALSLITKSSLINLPPFARLKVYVDASLEKEERKNPSAFRSNSAVLGGLGSAELPDWLMSKVVVRRIVVYEETTGDSLIANIYHTLTQQVNSLDKTFNGRVNEKKLFGGGNEEDTVSVAENYKVKQTISDGDLAVLSVYTEQYHDMASIVDPTIDHQLVDTFINHFKENPFLRIEKHHIVLTQWALSKAISPRGIPLLNKPALLNAMGVTQALLWFWGFEELSLLMNGQSTQDMSSSANMSTTRVGKVHLEKFKELYPYTRSLTATANTRTSNLGLKAIDVLAAELIKSDWIISPPAAIIPLVKNVTIKQTHHISAEIRHNLGDLILKINEL